MNFLFIRKFGDVRHPPQPVDREGISQKRNPASLAGWVTETASVLPTHRRPQTTAQDDRRGAQAHHGIEYATSKIQSNEANLAGGRLALQ
jgi:hypothetical protein